MQAMSSIPSRLVNEIRAGNCVAFVGAGFSAAAVPGWVNLLRALADTPGVSADDRALIGRLISGEPPVSKDLEAAAQILRDRIGPEGFPDALRSAMPRPPLNDQMHRRLDLLRGIPFRSVLTTNFDGLLEGHPPGREAYLRVLRPSSHRWWDARFWDSRQGPDVVHLHGDVGAADDVVFTRTDYRRRLYASPGYTTFLRSVMSTTTVLYLGFSFTDAYLDDLRSEILALLDYQGGDHPIAYALLHGVDDDEIAFAREHEGIEILPYEPGDDFTGFDDFLGDLHAATNPTALLGGLLSGARILWVDPDEASIDHGMQFLENAASGRASIERFDTPRAAIDAASEAKTDLIVTRWGHGQGAGGEPAAIELLNGLRQRAVQAPVVVFASGAHADENKREAMALGAASYEFTWEGLFQEIERIFTPGSSHR